MALSLDDIKKNKATRSTKSKLKKPRKQSSSAHKTKPWEKPQETIEASFKKLDIEDSDLLQKTLDWSRKIKLFPVIDIPIPDFLLTREDD